MYDLKGRRIQLGLTLEEVGDYVGVGKSTVRKWENGDINNMGRGYIGRLAEILQISPLHIIRDDYTHEYIDILPIYNQLEPPRQRKVYSLAEHELEEQRYIQDHDDYVGQTAAGLPIEGQQPIPFVGAETVSLLVNGDSMEDLFFDGDVVEYHPQPELENGEIGVFAINGGITLKKFKNNGDIRLESLNKKYQDIVIQETDDFNILGKVIL